MTIAEALDRVKLVTPSGWPDELLLSWLSEVEGMLQVEILHVDLNEVRELTEINDAELTAKHPYDKIYPMYIKGQIEFANGEFTRSANSMQMYNTYWDAYAVWVLNHLRPEYGEAVRHGYYLSAYGIAKEYGYKGTEEEWLKSLVGPKGDPGPQGPAGDGVASYYGASSDGVTYKITSEDAPAVKPGSGGGHEGKGKQIIFIPKMDSASRVPAIRINEGALVEIRMRRSDALSAELPSAGYLKTGVPYLMTFCGLYWLIDSWIYEKTGVDFKTDETLTLENGVLSVNVAEDAEQDNTLPISSAAVYTEIGNIDAILKTI